MKKMLLIAVVAVLLSSCGFESYQCATYGSHKAMTKHGYRAQTKYAKGKI